MPFLTSRRMVTRTRRHPVPPPAAPVPAPRAEPPQRPRALEGCAWTCTDPGGPGLDPTGAGPLPARENGRRR